MERYVEAESYPFPYNGDLRPENSAVLVIDMQVDFCGAGGWAEMAGANMNVMRAERGVMSTLGLSAFWVFRIAISER